MRQKRYLMRIVFLAVAVIGLWIYGGCGYSIHRQGSLPFRDIQIGQIENRTLEPKLQDRLHRALVEEFTRQGIVVTSLAAKRLTGVIKSFDMVSLSEKNGITVEYRVIMNADFRLIDGSGTARDIRDISTPFIVSFAGSDDMGRLISSKEAAEERALRDIASEIAGALIFQ